MPITGCECGDEGVSCKKKFIFHLNRLMFVLCDAILGAQLRQQKQIVFKSSSCAPILALNSDLIYTTIIIPKIIEALKELPKSLTWNPQNHNLFYKDQRDEIFTTLCCWVHSDERGLNILSVEVLHMIFAYVCAPPFTIMKRCLACGKTGTLKRCSGCKLASFCDINCQKANKQKHDKLCKEITHVKSNVLDVISSNDKKGMLYSNMLFGERDNLSY